MFGDNGALSFQLDMYRWEDHLRRMRDIREQNYDQAAAAVITVQYNELADRYNGLIEMTRKIENAFVASRTQNALYEAEKALKNREINDLKQQVEKLSSSLKRSYESWNKEADYYKGRALKAEGELKELRSQTD